MKDFRDLKPTSSLLMFMRCGGSLMIGSQWKIRSDQGQRALVLFKNDVWKDEFEFSNAGLFLAFRIILESAS